MEKLTTKDRSLLKNVCLAGYDTWSAEEFKEQVRINGETFDFILKRIAKLIHKEPIYMVPNPIEDQCQLGLAIYRFTLGCSFKVIVDMFRVSQSLSAETFNNVIISKCYVII